MITKFLTFGYSYHSRGLYSLYYRIITFVYRIQKLPGIYEAMTGLGRVCLRLQKTQ